MVASDTTRSKIYIKQLIKHKLIPKYILLLLNNKKNLLYGQSDKQKIAELPQLLNKENIKYDIAPNDNINSTEVIETISKRPESVFIFSGFGGVLLNDNILNIGKKFLHVHGGYLPHYKGSTTNYYSLIEENKIGASSIFLTKKIDSGPILIRKKFSAPKNRKEIDHIFDSEARSKVLIETLKQKINYGHWSFDTKSNRGGETYYIIHPILKHLSIVAKKKLL